MSLRLAFAARIAAAVLLIAGGGFAAVRAMETLLVDTGAGDVRTSGVERSAAGQTALARLALERKDAQTAVRTAADSLSRRPLDAATLRFYALGLLGTGDTDHGSTALTLASQLGWRDIATQRLLLGFALSANDMKSAAIRIDALLRQKENADQVLAIARGMLVQPGAPATLAERLADRPAWRRDFLMSTDLLPAAAYAPHEALLAELDRLKSPVEPSEINVFERTLIAKGFPAQAIAVSRQFGMLRRQVRTGFDQIEQGPDVSPFAWAVTPGQEAALQQPGPASVIVETDGQTRTTYLSRVMATAPGTHEFRVVQQDDSANGAAGFAWAFTCLPGGTALSPQATVGATGAGRETAFAFETSAACPAVRIALTGSGNQLPGAYSARFVDARWR